MNNFDSALATKRKLITHAANLSIIPKQAQEIYSLAAKN
jgi:hypothetical protein